jgi:hypothetical protein
MRIALLSPQPIGPALATGALTVVAVAGFCLAYTGLAGDPEDPGQATWWAVVNVLPFVLAFEGGKHRTDWGARAGMLAGAVAVSLLLDWAADLGFAAIRRLPSVLAVAGLLAVLDRVRPARPAALAGEAIDARSVTWIEGAGNYVVAHGAGPPVTYRATLASLEARLAREGFVRVHRSVLVRRDAIARVRDVDVVLADGTSVRTGARYRANLTG